MLRKEKEHLSTQAMGYCGEYRIISDLLSQGVECYRPCNDEVNTDLVAFTKGSFKRIQVKTIGVKRSKTSVMVKMPGNKNNAHIDYVAIYLWHEDLIAYYPYNGELHFTLALTRAKNNAFEKGERKWFYEYREFI